ncbi:unnamed protein product, partial [Didymodactylos carnosus]
MALYFGTDDRIKISRTSMYCEDQMSEQLLVDIKEFDQVQQQQFRNNNDDNDDDLKEILPPITVFNSDLKENSIKNLSKESVVFIWFQMLIEILLQMEHTHETTNEMLDECRRYYFEVDKELTKVLPDLINPQAWIYIHSKLIEK